MNAEIFNWRAYQSGAMVGFFDLSVSGLVVTGCRAFRKGGKLWFSWPSEKVTDRDGKETWKDVVACAEPVNRHLQGLVRGQLRVLLEGGNGSGPRSSAGRPAAEEPGQQRRQFKTPEGEDLSEYRSLPGDDDIPF